MDLKRKKISSGSGRALSWKNYMLFVALLPAVQLRTLLSTGSASSTQTNNIGGQVKETLVLENNTLLPGNAKVIQATSPARIAYDSSNGMLYVSYSFSDLISSITDREIYACLKVSRLGNYAL